MGRRRRFGQHRDRVVPQRIGCRAVAFERDEQRRKRIADNAMAFGVSASRSRLRRAGGVRRRAAAVGDLHRRRSDPTRAARRLLRAAARQAGGWSPTPSPPNPKPFSRSGIRASAESCDGSSTTAASRSAGSPAGGRRCPSPSGRCTKRMTVYFIGAGPGAADLITVRGQRLLAAARSACTRVRSCPTICWRCARRMRG